MKATVYWFLIIFTFHAGIQKSVAQCNLLFSDDFSGSLSSWQNTSDWTTLSGELKHNLSNVSGESYIYSDVGYQDFTTGLYEWQFCMRNGAWDPSSNNKFEYILFSDTTNISGGVNGYSVGINQSSGTVDEIMLYKLSLGSHNTLITLPVSTFDWNTSQDVCFRVTRNSSGDWSVYYNPDGSGELLAGSANEATWTTGNYMGLVFSFTSTRAGDFFVDDVSLCKDSILAVPDSVVALSFSNYPVGCVAKNNPFSIQVCGLNSQGVIDSSFSGTVVLSENSGTATMSGTTSMAFSNGCALFDDIQIDLGGTYQLLATYNTITGTSDAILFNDACSSLDTLIVMTYNLLNFPNGANDCGTSLSISNRQDTLRKILDYVQPDILMVCELQNETGANLILNSALNHSGETKYQRADFVPNGSTGYTLLNNMFFYNSDKISMKKQGRIITTTRDVGHYTVYGNDPNIAIHGDTTFINFFETHLKAGSLQSDQTRRGNDANTIKNYVSGNTNGFNILGGDFNLYTDQEAAYQTLCYSGSYPFNDPVQREGAWTANVSYRTEHTQSSRASGTPTIECGSTGGLDDRFDFLLVSDSIMASGGRLEYIQGSYEVLGNDGSVFNKSINDPSNTSGVPSEVLNAMYYMSDHLPVIIKIAVKYPGYVAGNEEVAAPNIVLFPNPVTSQFLNVKIAPEIQTGVQVDVLDMLGRQRTSDFISNGNNFSLDLKDLENGNYFLRIRSAHNIFFERFVMKK